jgi:uncharacterized protein (DUF111 family)
MYRMTEPLAKASLLQSALDRLFRRSFHRIAGRDQGSLQFNAVGAMEDVAEVSGMLYMIVELQIAEIPITPTMLAELIRASSAARK